MVSSSVGRGEVVHDVDSIKALAALCVRRAQKSMERGELHLSLPTSTCSACNLERFVSCGHGSHSFKAGLCPYRTDVVLVRAGVLIELVAARADTFSFCVVLTGLVC